MYIVGNSGAGATVMSRCAEGISITESTGRGVALSAELSLQPVQAYSIFTDHIAGNLLFSDGEETVRSSAENVERADIESSMHILESQFDSVT